MPALILRRTCPDHHDEKKRNEFWSVDCVDVRVGTIVLHQGRSDSAPVWQWVIHLHAGRHQNGMRGTDGSAGSREEAMVAFRHSFEQCLAHIGSEGWHRHLCHMALVSARAAGPKRY
ncbi:hypothetical protein B6S44_19530 [Bosea sp. Tri-44]|uniref:hypothetical protein n=1 Tax=Bosea sp. Tri-44 TaxID=1972137 RepID=UPI00100F5B0E|nr:hypothetical protein [Bosea sp. Tri-44]RXT52933.1 hypothetical protein B6S44_19530 [Bosea sp. Tri-44]